MIKEIPNMWEKTYRKFTHSNQDTNNAIESYHMYLKYRYLYEDNNSCHKRVELLLFILLTKVEVYYIHNQRLKEAGIIKPIKCEKQETLSKDRPIQIPDEDCLHDPKSMNGFLVHSQNKDTLDTLYNFIYIGSEFNFCSCDWALNGNLCKHVFKVQMWVSEHDLDINTLANVPSIIIDRHVFLVYLNQTVAMNPLPKDQPNINHVNILSDHVDPDATTLNNMSDL
jgi:hypothetical protein